MATQQTDRKSDNVLRYSLADRRAHRRHDLECRSINVTRVNPSSSKSEPLGTIIDISAGGIRFRSDKASFSVNQQVRIHIELPPFAGINPFVDASSDKLKPSRSWTGWLAITRVNQIGTKFEVAGRLVDMDELDRGMLSLYLSTHPLAA